MNAVAVLHQGVRDPEVLDEILRAGGFEVTPVNVQLAATAKKVAVTRGVDRDIFDREARRVLSQFVGMALGAAQDDAERDEVRAAASAMRRTSRKIFAAVAERFGLPGGVR